MSLEAELTELLTAASQRRDAATELGARDRWGAIAGRAEGALLVLSAVPWWARLAVTRRLRHAARNVALDPLSAAEARTLAENDT